MIIEYKFYDQDKIYENKFYDLRNNFNKLVIKF